MKGLVCTKSLFIVGGRGHISSSLSVCRSFVRSLVTLSWAKHNVRTTYANVLKFHIGIPREKIGDPYFFI